MFKTINAFFENYQNGSKSQMLYGDEVYPSDLRIFLPVAI
jgi:hypothetical protein